MTEQPQDRVRRVAELAGWFTREEWSEHEAIPLGKNYVVLAGRLTDSGLIVLIEELLRADWRLNFGYREFYWDRCVDGIYGADGIEEKTLERATMLAYVAMKEQQT